VKGLLADLVKRLDAMTQRERVFIFGAGAVAILAVVYVGGIEPALKRRALLEARANDQATLLTTAEAQKRELQRTLAEDPAAALRARIAAKQKEIASIDAQLASLQRTLIAPDRMASVLEELVGRSAAVKLVSLRNLPAAPLVNGKAPADAAQAATAAAHVYRHGVEIVVEGSYADLLAYVGRIERQSWQVYWGRTVMAAEYPRVQLTLTLYTLSLDRAWLVV
jgi:MSHA biogenesis protein MshJ